MTGLAYLALGGAAVLVYLATCLVLYARRSTVWWYAVPLGLVAALTYATNMWYAVIARGGTIYNGLLSDNTFQVAYINNVLHGNYLGDVYDKVVPSHYPPLYFWIAGTFGRLVGADAITTSVAAPAVVLLLAPLLVLAIGRQLGGDRVGFFAAVAFIALGNAMVSYLLDTPRTFPPMTWGIYKPYELLAGLLAIQWMIESVRVLGGSKGSGRRLLLHGALGGVIFLLYYPWFVIAVGAAAVFALVETAVGNRRMGNGLSRWAGSVGLAVAAGAPAWLPYAAAVLTTGADPNYAWQYTTLSSFDPSIVTIGLGYAGVAFFLGVHGFVVSRHVPSSRALGVMLVALYVWFLSAFVTYPLFGETFLSWKGRILIFVVVAFGAGIGIEHLRSRFASFQRLLSQPAVVCVAILPLLPTILQWNPVSDAGLRAAQDPIPSEVQPIVASLGGTEAELTVIASTEIAPFLPVVSRLRLYTSHTIHFSNPLADFAERRAAIEGLRALSSDAMGRAVSGLGVDALVLDRLPDGGLGLLLPESARPTSIFDGEWPFSYEQVVFSADQFGTSDFAPVYEDESLVVYRLTINRQSERVDGLRG